jgi:methionyl-tRNA synthetase
MKKFYVTTPIYYANAGPHLGSAYTTIAADVLARWHRQRGEEVFFLTGTDEHGQKIQETAEKKEKSPKEFVDKIAEEFREAFRLLNISNNNFIRTTDSYHQKEVEKILQELYDKKYIYKGFYEAHYCVGCEQYKTESELLDGKCPLHNKEPELRKEEAYLFKLSNFQGKLLSLIKEKKLNIHPSERREEIISFIQEGLKDISISRLKEKVYWGIPLPFDKKHTCFVWVDAFWNYVSGLKTQANKNKFWPADLQLMAKDIIRVHATIWPAILLALNKKLPRNMFVHGYFTVNGQKMSKSIGNVISPDGLIKKYKTESDSLRYYLMRNIPFGNDGDVSEKGFIDRYNNELADKLGNLVSRVAALIEKYGTKKTTASLLKKLKEKEIEKHFENYELDKVLNEIFAFVDHCNQYIAEKKPWETHDKEILFELKESILKLAKLLWPFIPEASEKITKQFSAKNIKRGEVLFRKI